jgi:uncharacterized protein YndB with AHSA1/START domain
MSNERRLEVRRRIAAPAHAIFAIVTDPNMHVVLDGSGMLLASPDASPLCAVGDGFDMKMDREPLGDIPLGKYEVHCEVTAIEPDALLEWNVGLKEHDPIGHVYGFVIEPAGDEGSDVVNYCDWTKLPEAYNPEGRWPIVPASMLEQSLVNLEAIAIRGQT